MSVTIHVWRLITLFAMLYIDTLYVLFALSIQLSSTIPRPVMTFWMRLVTGCASSPCLNGGTCANQSALFTCFCRPGYTDSFCQSGLLFEISQAKFLTWGKNILRLYYIYTAILFSSAKDHDVQKVILATNYNGNNYEGRVLTSLSFSDWQSTKSNQISYWRKQSCHQYYITVYKI